MVDGVAVLAVLVEHASRYRRCRRVVLDREKTRGGRWRRLLSGARVRVRVGGRRLHVGLNRAAVQLNGRAVDGVEVGRVGCKPMVDRVVGIGREAEVQRRWVRSVRIPMAVSVIEGRVAMMRRVARREALTRREGVPGKAGVRKTARISRWSRAADLSGEGGAVGGAGRHRLRGARVRLILRAMLKITLVLYGRGLPDWY